MSKQKPNSNKPNIDELKGEVKLQGVVLADSFTKVKFRPITLEKPKVLLPVCNIPMIDYCLEMLINGGVLEIFVFAAAHANQVASYLEECASMWLQRAPHVTIKCIIASSAMSAGDALRHLDRLDVIKNDFVLVSGDCISTIDLQHVIKQHKERVRLDKKNLMTMVLKKSGAPRTHRTRALADDLILILNEQTNQILSYENELGSERSQGITTEMFQENPFLSIRSDLMDTHIDICTPEVLLLFTDNFDYQDIRNDFVRGILGSEVLGNKIYGHIAQQNYATRLIDLRTYDSVSRDVIQRWTYPMVPDTNLLSDTTYIFERDHVYKEQSPAVSIERGAVITCDSVIGANTKIGTRTNITRSVIGRDCVIGKDCIINSSYIWGKVIIEDGCRVDRAILADGVILKKGAVVERGAVLSFNVVIGPGFKVEPYKLLTTLSQTEGLTEVRASLTASNSNPLEVGESGVGRIYDPNEDDDGNEDNLNENNGDDRDVFYNLARFHLNSMAPDVESFIEACRLKFVESDNEDDDDFHHHSDHEVHSMDSMGSHHSPHLQTNQQTSSPSTSSQMPSININPSPKPMEDKFSSLCSEIHSTLHRGHTSNLDVDGVVLELTSLKLTNDATLKDFFSAIFLALFSLISIPSNTSKRAALQNPSKAINNNLGQILKTWHVVFLKFSKQVNDKHTLITSLEEVCLEDNQIYFGLFKNCLQFLSQNFEVLPDEVILEWERRKLELIKNNGSNTSASLIHSKFLSATKEFLDWLKEEEEEEEEDD